MFDEVFIAKSRQLGKVVDEIEDMFWNNIRKEHLEKHPDDYGGLFLIDCRGDEDGVYSTEESAGAYLIFLRLMAFNRRNMATFPVIIDEEPFFSEVCDHNFLKLDCFLMKDADNRIKILQVQTPTSNGELYKLQNKEGAIPFEAIRYMTKILPLELDTFSPKGTFYDYAEKLECGCRINGEAYFYSSLEDRINDFLDVLINKMNEILLYKKLNLY